MPKEIRALLEKMPKVLRSNFVFNTSYGKPYGMNRLGKIWRAAREKVGLSDITCYGGTRHSFASQKYNQGKSKDLIGEWLGHADKQTTNKYAHVCLEGLRKVLDE